MIYIEKNLNGGYDITQVTNEGKTVYESITFDPNPRKKAEKALKQEPQKNKPTIQK